MKKIIYIMGILSLITSCFVGKSKKVNKSNSVDSGYSIYDISIKTLDGKNDIKLSDFKGKYLVIVNTASECGYTYQYKDLQAFYTKYSDQGVTVLGCPSNQFGGQEPGTAEEIEKFCKENYHVTFPMSEKIDVKGEQQHKLYQWLTRKELNGSGDFEVKWNFNKFIINPEGRLIYFFGSNVKPSDELFLKTINLK